MPHLYWIPLLIVAGAIFLFLMMRWNRRAGVSPPETTDPKHLERDDDPARRRAMSKRPDQR
ncbi:MAG TPA: hypothetical protein VEQ65_02620 [Opitutus sp.]|nr:hypothetical protein [Opitutus sp.]